MSKLGVQESVGTFTAGTNVTPITDRVLRITVSCAVERSGGAAGEDASDGVPPVPRRGTRAQQKPILADLEQRIATAKQQVNSINAQISQLPAQRRHAGYAQQAGRQAKRRR